MRIQQNEEAQRAWQAAENLQIKKIREAMVKQLQAIKWEIKK